jgi:hypothetical protein
MTTLCPTGPLVGLKVPTVGVGGASTVNELDEGGDVPPGVVTVSVPVVAPVGTVVVICESLFTVRTVWDVPLNDTDVAPVNPLPVTTTVAPTTP